jgi:hypothetical protein
LEIINMAAAILMFLALVVITLPVLFMGGSDRPLVENSISSWAQAVPNLQGTTSEFYQQVAAAVEAREVPGVSMRTVLFLEGGIQTDKREYLRIERGSLVYDLCAAPFGGTFFVSSWLAQKPSKALDALASAPLVGGVTRALIRLFDPLTYFKLDSARMFQAAVHEAVLEVIDQMTSLQNVAPLTELQRRPVMPELSGIRISQVGAVQRNS